MKSLIFSLVFAVASVALAHNESKDDSRDIRNLNFWSCACATRATGQSVLVATRRHYFDQRDMANLLLRAQSLCAAKGDFTPDPQKPNCVMQDVYLPDGTKGNE